MAENIEMKLFGEEYEDTPETLSYEYVLDFSDAIDEMAEMHNMTYAQIAESAGMKASTLSQILSGRSNPTVKTMERVAMALDCKMAKPRLVSFIETEAEEHLSNALPICNVEYSRNSNNGYCDLQSEIELNKLFEGVSHV